MFWKYEWDKHGTCYLFLAKNISKSTHSNEYIYKEYFINTVTRARALNITFEAGTVYNTAAQFTKKIGIPTENYQAFCRSKNKVRSLYEIRICYDTATPGQEKYAKCPPTRDQNLCKFPFNIRWLLFMDSEFKLECMLDFNFYAICRQMNSFHKIRIWASIFAPE